jgi:general stress protein 26
MVKEEQLNENMEKFISMMKEANICMMITTEKKSDHPSGRPMAINQIEQDGSIWFFSKETAKVTDELEEERLVSLAIINESTDTYLMIYGEAILSDDKEKMKALWKPVLKAWFPKGLDDPDMKLIKVLPTSVDYWDNDSSKMIKLLDMAKSMVQGKQYHSGERGKLTN